MQFIATYPSPIMKDINTSAFVTLHVSLSKRGTISADKMGKITDTVREDTGKHK